jgi:hypothetical protein
MKFIGAVFLFVLLLIIQVRFFALTPPYEVIYSLNTSTLIVNPVLKFANLIVFSVNVTKSVYNLSNQPEEMSLPQNTEAIVYNINKGNLTFEGEINVTLLNNKIIINSTPQLIRVIINQSNFSRLIWVGYVNYPALTDGASTPRGEDFLLLPGNLLYTPSEKGMYSRGFLSTGSKGSPDPA